MSDHSDLTLDQILDVDWYMNHPGVSQQEVREAFVNALHNPNVRMFHTGNTILMVDVVDKDFHFINADSFPKFVQNVKTLLPQCGESEIHTDFTNPRIIDVAKQAGVDFEVTQVDDEFIMTVRL